MAESTQPEWLKEELARREAGVKPLPDWLADELQQRGAPVRRLDGSTTQGQKGN